jgi:hypothetical protein
MYLQDMEKQKREEMKLIKQVMVKDAAFGEVAGAGKWSVKKWGNSKGGLKSKSFRKFLHPFKLYLRPKQLLKAKMCLLWS